MWRQIARTHQTCMLILINNSAAQARRLWPHIKDALTNNNLRFDVYETTCAGDAEARTRAALRAGCQTIAVVGGDGTLSEAASGFFEVTANNNLPPQPINFMAALAVLPAGTGNDFARSLLGRQAPLQHWVQRLMVHCQRNTAAQPVIGNSVDNPDKLVDVLYGSVDDGARKFVCLNAATLGLGADVAGSVAGQNGLLRRLSGEARFAIAAVGALAGWRERRVRVRIDGNTATEWASNLIAIANGAYAGGGMMLAPAARPDDGRLDVMVARDATRAIILRELTRIHRGGHIANPRVQVMRGTCVEVEPVTSSDKLAVEADGDVRGLTPAKFRVFPAALRFVS